MRKSLISPLSIPGFELKKFNASQPRVPAGNPKGGEFRSSGGGVAGGGEVAPLTEADKDTGTFNAPPESIGNIYISSLTDKVPFVGDKEVGKILEAATKADKDWQYLLKPATEKTVSSSDLRSLQPGVTKATVEQYQAHFKAGGDRPTPYVIQHKGKYYLRNGTHTSVAQILNGETKIKVAILVKTEE